MSIPISDDDALPVEVDATIAVRDTSDGFVFALLAGLYGRDLDVLGLTSKRHHKIVSALATAREVSQPAAAVYLAVKRVPLEEQPAVLSRLDPSQESLFDVFADVLDEVFDASQLQRLVALHAGRLAFSSPHGSRLLEGVGTPADLAPTDAERPDARLQRMLDAVADTTGSLMDVLGRRHAAVTARVGLPAWDLHDEHAWRRNQASTPDAVALVETELAQVLRPWLVQASDLPCLLEPERERLQERLTDWVAPAMQATEPLQRA